MSFFLKTLIFIGISTTLLASSENNIPEKPMVIVIPSYKNVKWCKKNLASIFMQNYRNYRIIYIDDCSPDNTAEEVEKFVKLNYQGLRFLLKKNLQRIGAMANIYDAIHSCRNNDIVLLVDGDDWLYHDNVLKELNEIYSTNEVWFTHGRLLEYPSGGSNWCIPVPNNILQDRSYRTISRHPTHLRTFYAGLFKKIKKEDFLYQGEFLKMAWDMAIMIPLLEMAEERHVFINKINYVYNIDNPINDNKVDPDLQNQLDRYIRSMPPYQRLEYADFLEEDF